jgi:hypothetical protein
MTSVHSIKKLNDNRTNTTSNSKIKGKFGRVKVHVDLRFQRPILDRACAFCKNIKIIIL